MIFDRNANLKYKYGNRHFWCRGYYVDTVGKNKKAIEEYIRKQLQEDIATDQISIKEYVDPFEKEEKQKEKNMKKGLGPLKWQPEKEMWLANRSEGLKPRSASTIAFQAKSKPPVLHNVKQLKKKSVITKQNNYTFFNYDNIF